MVASAEETGDSGADYTEGLGRDVQNLAEYFYDDNGLLASTRVARLHRDFGTFMELIKMVSMVYKPCLALMGHSAETYILQMTGERHA